jgi:hypothetical protein
MATSNNPPLSKREAVDFANKWKSFKDEKQHARGFWSEFFRTLCGVNDEEIAGIEYEKRVKSTISGNQEYIDVYWKNVVLIEHKSAGENLDKAELQARGYWLSLPPGYRPKTIIVSDFLNFRLIDVAINRTHEFPLSKLPENIHRFEAIISGNRALISEEEITVDQEAARLMANLYLELESHGFEGHETSIFLIRILFLLFGDDTGMWGKNSFLKLVMGTKEDGSDIGSKLDVLFDALNTPKEMRPKHIAEEVKDFPYVNGGIFAEKISEIKFNNQMRNALVNVANYNWTTINPTIFGSLFQLIKTKEERHALGEHYTSEENINKIIYPLFLDDLQSRLADAWDNKKELKKLRQDLAKIRILDPACGCGNFLVVAYKHLRQFELELTVRLQTLEGKDLNMGLDGTMGLSVSLNQFFGIEIEEWPAQVARVALFLTDHQENLKFERITGAAPNRFPIRDAATIVNTSALDVDWNEIVAVTDYTYVLGNPPFLGSLMLSDSQKKEQKEIWRNNPKSGIIDFVANWYLLAARYIYGTNGRVAFVSTNSIVQGEQTAILWNELNKYNVNIDFAHQTFAWENSSSDKAAVHCVIIGYSTQLRPQKKQLWTYEKVSGEPTLHLAKQINSYLVDAPNVIIGTRQNPLGISLPPMTYGSMPRDDGQLSKISEDEAAEIRRIDPIAAKYLYPLIGATELLNGKPRYCLWLVEASPAELRSSKVISERVKAVREFRSASTASSTRSMAETAHLFAQIAQPKSDYIAIPRHSSSSRRYVPMAFKSSDVIASDALMTIPNANLFVFSIVMSSVFNVWLSAVSGRIKSDFRISQEITYNNFPLPECSTSEIENLSLCAATINSARDSFPDSTLSELYASATMQKVLLDAHKANDKAVLSIFGLKPTSSDYEILQMLFTKYAEASGELK